MSQVELHTSYETWMAEWGNPAVSDGSHTLRSELTRGTETSKYPKEREINRDALSSGERKGP